MVRTLPVLMLPLAILVLAQALQPWWILIPLHLLTFFTAAMVCHGELARDRPSTRHLTEFYLWMSFGGVLGGLFNALLAPLVFPTVAEYPIAMALACLYLPAAARSASSPRARRFDLALPLGLGGGTVLALWALEGMGAGVSLLVKVLVFSLLAGVCFTFTGRPVRYGLGMGALLLASLFGGVMSGRLQHMERSFFSVHRVMVDEQGKYRLLFHGTTNHGLQSLDPARSREPLAYFYRTGPIGQVFTEFRDRICRPRIAIVGLGTGSMACYAEPGQHLTFYEIDPTVVRIASNPRYFTYLKECRGNFDVVLGDGRLTLARAPEQWYGMIVLDAFSSDSIPTHLVTREAMALYLSKLSCDGVLAFNVSNRHLDIEPILGDLARDAGLVCRAQLELDEDISEEERSLGKLASHFVIMARKPEHLGRLARDRRWRDVTGRPDEPVCSDDFPPNILKLFRKGTPPRSGIDRRTAKAR
jgi:spermidine synthase